VSARRQTDLRPADSDRRVARQLALIQDDAAFVEGGRGDPGRPPDPFGASPRQQARWLNESERLVWSDRRVGGLSAS
jgi:hypothetical protein